MIASAAHGPTPKRLSTAFGTLVEKNLEIDNLVILVDNKVPCGQWKLGRVVKPEVDKGHVRKAYVKTADGKTVLRDWTKLVHLKLDEDASRDLKQEDGQED